MSLFIGCSTVNQCDTRCKWFCLSVALLYINVIFAANDFVYRLLYCTSMWYSLQMILFIGCSIVHQCDIRCKWFFLSVALLYINVIFAANDSVYRLLYCTSMWYSLQMILFWGLLHQCNFRCKMILFWGLLHQCNFRCKMILFWGLLHQCNFRCKWFLFWGCSIVHQCDIHCKWFCLSVALL